MLSKRTFLPIKHSPIRKIGILGLGRTGIAAIKLALKNHIEPYVYDDKPNFIPNEYRNFYKSYHEWPWNKLDAVILSPGVPTYLPKPHVVVSLSKNSNVPMISDIELVIRLQGISKWVVITGTNGKSTTTALTAHILKSAGKSISVGGNLGTPMAELDSPGKNGIRVVELSSYQLEITPSLNPDVSAILNLSPDHLERHGSMANYAAAKAKAIKNVKSDGLIILGNNPNLLSLLPEKYTCSLYQIKEADIPRGAWKNIALSGSHNAENAAVAARICRHFDISEKNINKSISSFKGLPHRLELVASCNLNGNRLHIINDSKATNDDAASKALSSFQHIFWCAGGIAKEKKLTNCIAHLSHVERAYLYGDSQPLFQSELSGLLPITLANNLKDATNKAFADAKQFTRQHKVDSFILLSPAAASFDAFENFEVRGKQFTDLAKILCQQVKNKEAC